MPAFTPDGAYPDWGCGHLIAAYYSFIYPRTDDRLIWPRWLTYGGRFTHISGHPSAVGRAQDSESSTVKDQRSTSVLRNQPVCRLLLHPRQIPELSAICLYRLIAQRLRQFVLQFWAKIRRDSRGSCKDGWGIKKVGVRPIPRFISKMVQDATIVTMENEYELVCGLSNGTVFSDLKWPPNMDFKVTIFLNVK